MSLHTGVSPSGLRHGTLTPRFAGSNPATPASRPLGFSARDHNKVDSYPCTAGPPLAGIGHTAGPPAKDAVPAAPKENEAQCSYMGQKAG